MVILFKNQECFESVCEFVPDEPTHNCYLVVKRG